MDYIDEFRDGALARQVVGKIAAAAKADRRYHLMEFCGGHTHALCRYGLLELLPRNVEMVHGPGCPVCVLPIGRLDQAIALARQPNVMLCAYGDMMRVPGKDRVSLMRARAEGANVRMVFGANDALALARKHPTTQVVFFAIGFETTTPTTALAVKTAQAEGLKNFSLFVNHVLGDRGHPRQPRGEGRPHSRRRLHRAGARQHHHRHRAVRALRHRLEEAHRSVWLRAHRPVAFHSVVGAAAQRRAL
jgi:hydrogenase expression/formation protein HypD